MLLNQKNNISNIMYKILLFILINGVGFLIKKEKKLINEF